MYMSLRRELLHVHLTKTRVITCTCQNFLNHYQVPSALKCTTNKYTFGVDDAVPLHVVKIIIIFSSELVMPFVLSGLLEF